MQNFFLLHISLGGGVPKGSSDENQQAFPKDICDGKNLKKMHMTETPYLSNNGSRLFYLSPIPCTT